MATQPDFQTAFPPRPGRKYFTVKEANQALPYVRRVLEDIRRAFREALELKRRLEQPMPGEGKKAEEAANPEGEVPRPDSRRIVPPERIPVAYQLRRGIEALVKREALVDHHSLQRRHLCQT